MGLHQVAQHVDDLPRAIAFYRDVLELRFITSFDPPGLGFFDLDGTRLLLEAGAPPALLYLGVDDIDKAWAALLDHGVETVAEPHPIHTDDVGQFGPKDATEWMAFFRDSEGNLVAFVEQREA